MIHAFLLYLVFQGAAQNAQQHQESGEAALKAGQTDVAISEFHKMIDLAPDRALGYLELGVAYMQNRDYGDAIPPLRRSLELDPSQDKAHQFLGYALLAEGYAKEAVGQLEAANDRAGLGVAQLETGNFVDAVQNLHAALVAQPNNPDLLYYLARASGLLAKQTYDVLLSSQPATPRANQALAENYSALRQTEQAEAHYKSALSQRPDLRGIHLALGELYAEASQWTRAEDEFRAEAKLQPGNAEVAYRLGSALLQNGNAHEARLELQRANSLVADMPETLYALGKAESLEGDYRAAERDWNRVITLEKTGQLASQSHFGLATIYRKEGKTVDAERETKLFEETEKHLDH